jgi:hypothetical protein
MHRSRSGLSHSETKSEGSIVARLLVGSSYMRHWRVANRSRPKGSANASGSSRSSAMTT